MEVEENLEQELGKRIKEYRKSKGWTLSRYSVNPL